MRNAALLTLCALLVTSCGAFDHSSKDDLSAQDDGTIDPQPVPQDLIERNLLGALDDTTWQLYDLKIAPLEATSIAMIVPCADDGDAVLSGSRILHSGGEELDLRAQLLDCRFSWINRAWAVNLKLTGTVFITAHIGAEDSSFDGLDWNVYASPLTATGLVESLTTLPDRFQRTSVAVTVVTIRTQRMLGPDREGTFSGTVEDRGYRWIIGNEPALVVTSTTDWCAQDESDAAAYCCASLGNGTIEDGMTAVAEFCACPDNTLRLGTDLEFNIGVCQCVLCDQ